MIVGQQLGPFTVEKELGSGAMGTVYLARYAKTGQYVAIKLLASGLGSNETALARFEQEATILKKLHHPNIVRFFGAGRFQGSPFYAMEYVQGESLDHVVERRGRVGWEQVIIWGKQLCAALQHAHEHGVIHRDLKPSNLIVLPDDTLKLSDFGIARDLELMGLTSTNTTVGTAAYMSPEQCRGERNLTPKADLYCLGVVLYELLTGTKPFAAETTMGMLMQHVRGKFERPARIVLEIPPWLDALVCQLLEKKPEHRPRNAAFVAESLDRAPGQMTGEMATPVAGTTLADRPAVGHSEADENGAARRRKKRTKQHSSPIYERGWFVTTAVVALLLAAGTGSYFLFFKPPSPESLYRAVERVMASGSLEDQIRIRDQAIQTFLDQYPDHFWAEQMQAWADEVDRALRERQLASRLAFKIRAEGPAESIARVAVQQEDDGDLEAAHEQWQKLLPYKDLKDSRERTWGLVAARRLELLATALQYDQRLRTLIDHASKTGLLLKLDDDWDPLAAEAARHELSGDFSKARSCWLEVKRSSEKPDSRPWYLLASRRARELSNKPAPASNANGTDPRPQP